MPTDRVWLRDSAPTAVRRADGVVELLNWGFNGWAKYDNYARDAEIGRAIAANHGTAARRAGAGPTTESALVLEGGGIEVNGGGLMLVTEEWLLTDVQVRNPGMIGRRLRAGFRRVSRRDHTTIWLGEGASATTPTDTSTTSRASRNRETVILAYEHDPADENHARSVDNLRRLELAAKTHRAAGS